MTDTLDPTPGLFGVHGVMVQDTTETASGMFCIRTARPTTSVGGRPMTEHGEILAYAYRLADAYLLAAAPEMLSVLVDMRRDLVHMRDTAHTDPMLWSWAGAKLRALDEIPVVAEAAAKAESPGPLLDRLQALRDAVEEGEADVRAREAVTGSGNDPLTAQRRANVEKARQILDLLSGVAGR